MIARRILMSATLIALASVGARAADPPTPQTAAPSGPASHGTTPLTIEARGSLSASVAALAAQPRNTTLQPAAPHGRITIDTNVIKAIREGAYLKYVAAAIARNLEGRSIGYAFSIVLADGATIARAGGAARHVPDSSPRAMSSDDRISIASSSKTISAAALMHALTAANLTIEEPIGKWLPSYWTFGQNFANITLHQLLTHTSGIRCGNVDYASLEACAAAGVNTSDQTYFYDNDNYALFRIIIPRIAKLMTSDKTLLGMESLGNSAGVAQAYATNYIAYVNSKVFSPIGFPTMSCAPSGATPALSYQGATSLYDLSSVGPGEIWGDMTLYCGSQGWQLSAKELATFMHELQTGSKIVGTSVAGDMRTEQLGMFRLDLGASTAYPGGLTLWHHNGYHPGYYGSNKGEVHTLVAYFNNGVTIGAIINSPIDPNDNFYPAFTAPVQNTAP